MLKHSQENVSQTNQRKTKKAAEGGHLEVLKYAHENGCPWGEWTCSKAARDRDAEAAARAERKREKRTVATADDVPVD